MEQRLPLVPLCIAAGDIGIEILSDIADRNAVIRLGYEFPLFPEHLLEFFILVEEFDDPAAQALDEAHHLEPTLGTLLA